jgi:hypothetical protein
MHTGALEREEWTLLHSDGETGEERRTELLCATFSKPGLAF